MMEEAVDNGAEIAMFEMENGLRPQQQGQRETQIGEDRSSLRVGRYIPLYNIRFTWVIIFSIWAFYIFGWLFINDTKDIIDKISPSAPILRFYTINKSCDDVRREVWRLFSNQFCHSSLQHIGYNTIMLLFFGFSCEILNGWLYSLFVFEAGVLFGTMAFSIGSPFMGLVGCSHGVAGLFGGVIPNFVVNIDIFDRAVVVGFWTFTLLTVLTEIINYYLFPVDNTAYIAHLFGFLGGLLIGLASVRVIKNSRWKYNVKILGTSSSFILFFGLIFTYCTRKWPPIDMSKYDLTSIASSSLYHDKIFDKMLCCERAYFFMEITGNRSEEVFQNIHKCH